MNAKYLITTDNWFIAPDGNEYKAAYGEVEILQDNFLGITTNRNSSNWYAKIGSDEKHVIIAGCQIHYAVKCEKVPNTEMAKSWDKPMAQMPYIAAVYDRPCFIYIAE